jgi:hypothetical protein
MFTITPPPLRCGRHARMNRNVASGPVFHPASNSSSGISAIGPSGGTCALFTRMSTVPYSRTVTSTHSCTWTGSVTSHSSGVATPSRAAMVAAVRSTLLFVRPATTTLAPASASASATPSPTPWPAPVTIATLPSSVRIDPPRPNAVHRDLAATLNHRPTANQAFDK